MYDAKERSTTCKTILSDIVSYNRKNKMINKEDENNEKITELLNRVLNDQMEKKDYEMLKNCLKNQKDSVAY